jgi:hypothetical protein
VLAGFVYFSTLIYLAGTVAVVQNTLRAFPADFYKSFGPHIPTVSEQYAAFLPYVANILIGSGLLSVLLIAFIWRSNLANEVKAFLALLLSVALLFLSNIFTLCLVIACFMLPKLANGI